MPHSTTIYKITYRFMFLQPEITVLINVGIALKLSPNYAKNTITVKYSQGIHRGAR